MAFVSEPLEFETVTDSDVAVAVLPDVSLATAEMLCVPFATDEELHEIEYGAAVTAEPTLEPSTVNWTLATATLSDAFADSVTVPVTVAPLAGAVIGAWGYASAFLFALVSVLSALGIAVVLLMRARRIAD